MNIYAVAVISVIEVDKRKFVKLNLVKSVNDSAN